MKAVKSKNVYYNLFEYIIAFALILNCRTIWVHLVDGASFAKIFALFLLFIGVLGCLVFKGKIAIYKLNKAISVIILLVGFFCVFYLLTNSDLNPIAHMAIAISILVLYYFACSDISSIPQLIFKYTNLVTIIAALSLIAWILFSVLKIAAPTGIVYSTWTGNIEGVKAINSYFGIYFETQTINVFGNEILRNTSIFTEAPMASFHFSIALAVNLFLRQKLPIKSSIILVIVILTTFSTSGYLVVFFALGIKLFYYVPKKKLLRELKLIVVPIGILILIGLGVYLINNKLSTSSGSVRIDDFIIGFKAWSENLIMGEGISSNSILQNFMNEWRSDNTGYSNSIMLVLVNGGVYLGLLYVYCFIKGAINSIKRKDYKFLIFEIIILFLFVVTVIPYQYITYLILIILANYKVPAKKYIIKFPQKIKV